MRIRQNRDGLPETHIWHVPHSIPCGRSMEAHAVGAFLYVVVLAAAVPGRAGSQPPAGRPAIGSETFHLAAAVSGQATTGSVTVPMVVQIDRYTPERARVAMTDALKSRGYPGFVAALRGSPAAGTLDVAGQRFVIRWAHQELNGAGRTVTIVTEKPVYFIGLGRPNAKSTEGYQVAVLKLDLDASGGGDGIMAAAARVKPRDVTGVQIDDYAETPVKLTVVAPAR
jgi:hypothetical protein